MADARLFESPTERRSINFVQLPASDIHPTYSVSQVSSTTRPACVRSCNGSHLPLSSVSPARMLIQSLLIAGVYPKWTTRSYLPSSAVSWCSWA